VRELELAVGEARRLELPGRGSAGYSWGAEVEGPEGVLEVRRVPSGSLPSAPVAAGRPPPASGSVPVVFELVGLAEGRVRVRLTLRRPFEEGVEPLAEEELDVTVTAVTGAAG
jgi:Chagasin family peptidase inhibitor I42